MIKKRSIAEMLVDFTSGVYEPVTNLKKEKSSDLLEKLKRCIISKDLVIFSFTVIICIKKRVYQTNENTCFFTSTYYLDL